MNSKSKSAFGISFIIRLGVLLVLLLGAGGAFAYDRFVLVPNGEKSVEQIISACTDLSADRAAVLRAAGREPTATETIGDYQIDDWTFSRILPNLTGFKVSVAYDKGIVTEVFRGGIGDDDRAAFRK